MVARNLPETYAEEKLAAIEEKFGSALFDKKRD